MVVRRWHYINTLVNTIVRYNIDICIEIVHVNNAQKNSVMSQWVQMRHNIARRIHLPKQMVIEEKNSAALNISTQNLNKIDMNEQRWKENRYC